MRAKLSNIKEVNYGQIMREVKIKKRIERSVWLINLSQEAKQWAQLSKALQKRIKYYGTD